ncbi:hypothetical protein OG345_42125 (plasmid) [Streptomyces sp. NBC_01220]|uniref:hypothetical protein n=1 Tax=Streptomyces sp. NBC_01220 TaxID=2903781 RepID=UPI00352E58AF|nr:hypothetical protein OG345_42125 [Streptomyces sp. NBC_01220]
MSLPAITHAPAATPLAALLPARRGAAWKVGPAEYGIRANAQMSRITSGERALVVVEQAGVIEVYSNRPDDFAVTPAVVVQASGPDPVAVLADRVLRSVLPRMERETANATVHAHGWQQVIVDKTADLNEVGFALIDHGASLNVADCVDGVGIQWSADEGATWGLWVLAPTGNLTLTYDGPVNGLYGVLPVLLPPVEGHGPTDAGSAFTRHLSDRFPQFRPLAGHEVEFGGYGDARGYVALPAQDEPTDYADDARRVVAELSRLGTDLLLTAVPHLV